jgi:hypothetical protein
MKLWIAREESISLTITSLLPYLCRLPVVQVLVVQSAAGNDQRSAWNVWRDTNFFSTVAMKGSAPILHIMLRMLSGTARNTAKVVTIPVKPVMDLRKINASLAVLMVPVDKHLIEYQLLANVYARLKWLK